MTVDRKFSDRMKLGREAAPWVIEEVERLEERVATWIPIEERQPEKGKIVLCKCLEDYVQTGFLVREEYWEDEDTTSYIFKNVYENFIVVEAWMELPE